MRRIAVLTSGRQDWGILRSTCRALRDDPRFDLRLLVGGMHCEARFGATERMIADEGFAAAERLPWADDGDAAVHAARAVELVAAALARQTPDALVLVGDRFETAAAGLAATLARVPLVHLHGGEVTEGAFDDALRNALTKLSHLHLVSHPDHARRVIALGEAPDAVHVVGAPGLDNLRRDDLADRAELERHLGIELAAPVVIVTLHPATLGADPAAEAAAVAAVMTRVAATYVITLPSADPGNEAIRAALSVPGPRRAVVEALGERRYWGLLRIADAVLGNSSSALIEAPALGVPAINIGDRQKGRLRAATVIDVPDADADQIAAALRGALAERPPPASPYGDAGSAERIVEILARWTPPRPPRKPPVIA